MPTNIKYMQSTIKKVGNADNPNLNGIYKNEAQIKFIPKLIHLFEFCLTAAYSLSQSSCGFLASTTVPTKEVKAMATMPKISI